MDVKMDKEKEIEKIAQILGGCHDCSCKECLQSCDLGCKSYDRALAIVNEGYGDVNEAVNDFAERVKIALFSEFADDMTFKMANKIEKIVNGVCEEYTGGKYANKR